MPTFKEIQENINNSRDAAAGTHTEFVSTRESLSAITDAILKIERSINDNNGQAKERLTGLKNEQEKLKNKLADIDVKRKTNLNTSRDFLNAFKDFSDPRKNLDQFSTASPILLFPIRIETRFKKVATAANPQQDQLWIRVYPDDCLIDSFEDRLTQSEVESGLFYWQKTFEAGGDILLEKGAWRNLVNAYSSGRALHIRQITQPKNLAELPVKINPADVFLIISAAAKPLAAQQNDIENYWKNSWLHADDAVQLQQDYDQFVTAIGNENAAKDLLDQFKPFNTTVQPQAGTIKAPGIVFVKYLQPFDAATYTAKKHSWTEAPQVNLLPERFVFTAYNHKDKNTIVLNELGLQIPYPLYVAPNPGLPEEEQFSKDADGNIILPDELKWLTDFDIAVANGMGIKINLTPAQAKDGFSKLIVLGTRLSANENKGQQLIEDLFDKLYKSKTGFQILPQGTATNNTEDTVSYHNPIEDPDDSFEILKQGDLFALSTDTKEMKDGQYLAKALGINPLKLMSIPNAGGTDMADAENINTVLWPATLGYYFETLLQPVLPPKAIDFTQFYFNKYVSGRGKVPAVKINKQPYGILPTTAFSKIKWFEKQGNDNPFIVFKNNDFTTFLKGLYDILIKIDSAWATAYEQVKFVGNPNDKDAHQTLLDVLGLTASSVEYFSRDAVSAKQVKSNLNFAIHTLFGIKTKPFNPREFEEKGMLLLNELGYDGTERLTPKILEKYFFGSVNKIKDNIIDDQPLSPDKKIRVYTTDNKNYIEWLLTKSNESYTAFLKTEGFINNTRPTALFFQFLYHALDLSFGNEALEQHRLKDLIAVAQIPKLKIDPDHVYVSKKVNNLKRPYEYLQDTNATVTGNNAVKVGDFIAKSIKTTLKNSYLSEQLTALETLKDLSTAALERLFAEHIDLCSYRLDAWKLGLVNMRLETLRQPANNQEIHKGGLYIGAFGWIENLRSENKALTPVEIPEPELKAYFEKNIPEKITVDNTNGGYIAAPSLNHATTAAILRNAYTSNKNPDAFQVNLSSERVRKALAVIEGIRNGQSLGALLGYYFEKALHSNEAGLELDYFMHQVRRAFPLVVNKIKDTKVDNTDTDALEAIEARNVTDGLALIKHVEKTNNSTYPFGFDFLDITGINAAQKTEIQKQINNIQDINDAVADVALAESVHQVVNGNYDTANATLEAYSKGSLPNIPEVVQTPRKGLILTHRVAVHLDMATVALPTDSPAAKAEPALNKWLGAMLPPLGTITCSVNYKNNLGNQNAIVSAANLNLNAIDILYALNDAADNPQSHIDELVTKWILQKDGTTLLDAPVEIDYITQRVGEFSFFEITPLIESLRQIVFNSKPLLPTDINFGSEAGNSNTGIISIEQNVVRLQQARVDLHNIETNELTLFVNAAGPLINNKAVDGEAIITALETVFIDPFLNIAGTLKAYGMDETGYGFIFTSQKDIVLFIKNHFKKHQKTFNDLLLKYTAIKNEYTALPPAATEQEKFNVLQKAEATISTILTTDFSVFATAAGFETHINNLSIQFNNKLTAINDVVLDKTISIPDLYNLCKAATPLLNFIKEDIDLVSIANQIIILAENIYDQALGLQKTLQQKEVKATTLFAQVSALPDPQKQLDKVQETAKLLFNDAFKIIPAFTLLDDAANELQNAYNNETKLLEHLTALQPDGSKLSAYPQEDWLYGIARVREKMQHFERVTMLTGAFKTIEPDLHPIQLPFNAGESWLAMEYPAAYQIDTDKLLYTVNFAKKPFVKADVLGGILIDEWTEVIPGRDEDIGIAFHYDKPNSEPVQSFLLALSPKATGAWGWEDLLDTVNETLDMAKKRAIEPVHIDALDYSKFLPAVIAANPGIRYFASSNFTIANILNK